MKWIYPIVGVLAFVVALAVMTPAAWLLAWSGLAAQPDVHVQQIRGSAWQGSVERLRAGALILTDVGWQLRPLALVTGRLRYAIEADTESGHLEGAVNLAPTGGLRIPALTVAAPLAELAAAAGVTALPMTGQVSARIAGLVVKNGYPIAAEGHVGLGGVSWLLMEPDVALGAFEAELDTRDGGGVVAVLADQGGPVTLRGQAVLMPDGQWRLDARLRPAQAADDPVRRLLDLLGAPDSQGWYRINQSGRL